MLFYATIVSPDDCIGDSFLPVNYTEGQWEIAYLPGEQSLVHAIYQYRKRYFHQFLIHRKQTGKMQKLMG
jgi:hypothetical protein